MLLAVCEAAIGASACPAGKAGASDFLGAWFYAWCPIAASQAGQSSLRRHAKSLGQICCTKGGAEDLSLSFRARQVSASLPPVPVLPSTFLTLLIADFSDRCYGLRCSASRTSRFATTMIFTKRFASVTRWRIRIKRKLRHSSSYDEGRFGTAGRHPRVAALNMSTLIKRRFANSNLAASQVLLQSVRASSAAWGAP